MDRSEVVLVDEPWNFMVFSLEGRWILTYFVQAAKSYNVSIHLTAPEVEALRASPLAPQQLVETFRASPETYRSREIHPPVWPSVSG
jgi:hypothetical protein